VFLFTFNCSLHSAFNSSYTFPIYVLQQSVALTGRNHTGPPYSDSLQTAHVPGGSRPATHMAAGPPTVLQTTTETREKNNTGPLGGPVINGRMLVMFKLMLRVLRHQYLAFNRRM